MSYIEQHVGFEEHLVLQKGDRVGVFDIDLKTCMC